MTEVTIFFSEFYRSIFFYSIKFFWGKFFWGIGVEIPLRMFFFSSLSFLRSELSNSSLFLTKSLLSEAGYVNWLWSWSLTFYLIFPISFQTSVKFFSKNSITSSSLSIFLLSYNFSSISYIFIWSILVENVLRISVILVSFSYIYLNSYVWSL